jgi:hypothetical protein
MTNNTQEIIKFCEGFNLDHNEKLRSEIETQLIQDQLFNTCLSLGVDYYPNFFINETLKGGKL